MAETIIKMTGGVIRQQKNTILKNVNVEIRSGEFVYLIGKVGSGKSSFLKTLYAELPLEYGTAEVAGFQLKKIRKSQIPLLRRKCGIVFQDFKLLTDRNVYDNLEFVLRATGWKNRKAIQERIENVLSKVGMLDKQKQMPHQLSGGEQQRIVLARALLNAPPLILADEPTGNIDPETSYRLVELLKEICDTGKTIIIATHQYDLIEKYPGRVLCCENGELFDKPDTVEDHTEIPVALTEVEEGEVAEMPEVTDLERQEEPAEEEISGILQESDVLEEKEEDILAMIGKLDYPEITAFDYELDHLPEIKPEEVMTAIEEEEAEQPQEIIVAGESSESYEEVKYEEEQPEKTPKPNPPVMDLELID